MHKTNISMIAVGQATHEDHVVIWPCIYPHTDMQTGHPPTSTQVQSHSKMHQSTIHTVAIGTATHKEKEDEAEEDREEEE